jgi:cytochrome c551/c552
LPHVSAGSLNHFPVNGCDVRRAGAAQALAQKSGRFKCHGIEKKKDGPALRDAAAKYKDRADAEERLVYHVNWILSLPGGTKY